MDWILKDDFMPIVDGKYARYNATKDLLTISGYYHFTFYTEYNELEEDTDIIYWSKIPLPIVTKKDIDMVDSLWYEQFDEDY